MPIRSLVRWAPFRVLQPAVRIHSYRREKMILRMRARPLARLWLPLDNLDVRTRRFPTWVIQLFH